LTVPTDAQRIEALETRLTLVVLALRGELSGMGRQFGGPTFDERWHAAEPVVEEEPAP
jgi:hypothetical protein